MAQSTENRSTYLNQIHQLKKLQKVDDVIHEKKKILEKAPKELDELRERFARLERTRAGIQEKLDILRQQEIRLNRENEEERARLSKSRDKLMATSNEREFNSVNREINNLEKNAAPRESEILALIDEMSTQNRLLAESEDEYTDLRAQIEARQVSLDEELDKAEKSLKQLKKERQACSRDIPMPIFQRYEFIRERLEHPVIVALRDTFCPSCNIAVPLQFYNDLLRGGQIMSCPNCQRLVVAFDDFIQDDPEALQKAVEEREHARPAHKKSNIGRSAALDRNAYKDETDSEAGFDDRSELDDELPLADSVEANIESMSRMANVSDLADMSETTGLTDMGGDSEDSGKDD